MLEKEYTYIDLCIHPYMFKDFEDVHEMLLTILRDNYHQFKDYEYEDIVEAMRRQFNGWIGPWNNGLEVLFERYYDIVQEDNELNN